MSDSATNYDWVWACQALGVKPKTLTSFEVQDPFNPSNTLTGYLCRQGDHRYGALAITSVNGEATRQVVWATPKLRYPFHRNGQFHWPDDVIQVMAYEKLDGTNILQYRYYNTEGEVFTTYKTRLTPVIREGGHADFLTLWRRVLAKYPAIASLATTNACSVAFELYGAANPVLVQYDTPIDAAVIFGVGPQGKVYPPSCLWSRGVPRAPRFDIDTVTDTPDALEHAYKRSQSLIEAGNRFDGEGMLRGAEGAVWYVETEAGWQLFKLKPPSVEAIHWAAGGPSRAAIWTTCVNALELRDPPLSFDQVLPLFEEEYDAEQIAAKRGAIDKALSKINQDAEIKRRVLHVYRAEGLDLRADKTACMRALSAHFKRAEMKRVYSILSAEVL